MQTLRNHTSRGNKKVDPRETGRPPAEPRVCGWRHRGCDGRSFPQVLPVLPGSWAVGGRRDPSQPRLRGSPWHWEGA